MANLKIICGQETFYVNGAEIPSSGNYIEVSSNDSPQKRIEMFVERVEEADCDGIDFLITASVSLLDAINDGKKIPWDDLKNSLEPAIQEAVNVVTGVISLSQACKRVPETSAVYWKIQSALQFRRNCKNKFFTGFKMK